MTRACLQWLLWQRMFEHYVDSTSSIFYVTQHMAFSFFREADCRDSQLHPRHADEVGRSKCEYGSIVHPLAAAGVFDVVHQSDAGLDVIVDGKKERFAVGQDLELMVGGRSITVVVARIERGLDDQICLRLLEQSVVLD